MVNPNIRARNRINKDLPEDLQILMVTKGVLSEEEHLKILEDIKKVSYEGKKPEQSPKFVMVVGQTGSGKSNLTAYIYNKDNNIVIIDSDKYKSYRSDNDELMKEHLVEYAYLTGPDSYLHRDEMIIDAMDKKYNILMDIAPSMKDGVFIDVDEIQRRGYNVEIHALGVSSLNSLLSVHERYEANISLNIKSAKLTGIVRHDDSFKALNSVIGQLQRNSKCQISVYERGREFPYIPELLYSPIKNGEIFSCPLEALMSAQQRDYDKTVGRFENRYNVIRKQMENREAPQAQIEQLEEVRTRYEKERGVQQD